MTKKTKQGQVGKAEPNGVGFNAKKRVHEDNDFTSRKKLKSGPTNPLHSDKKPEGGILKNVTAGKVDAAGRFKNKGKPKKAEGGEKTGLANAKQQLSNKAKPNGNVQNKRTPPKNKKLKQKLNNNAAANKQKDSSNPNAKPELKQEHSKDVSNNGDKKDSKFKNTQKKKLENVQKDQKQTSKQTPKLDKMSVDQLKEKIAEIQGRESLSKTAIKKLRALKKKLRIAEEGGDGNAENAKDIKSNVKNVGKKAKQQNNVNKNKANGESSDSESNNESDEQGKLVKNNSKGPLKSNLKQEDSKLQKLINQTILTKKSNLTNEISPMNVDDDDEDSNDEEDNDNEMDDDDDADEDDVNVNDDTAEVDDDEDDDDDDDVELDEFDSELDDDDDDEESDEDDDDDDDDEDDDYLGFKPKDVSNKVEINKSKQTLTNDGIRPKKQGKVTKETTNNRNKVGLDKEKSDKSPLDAAQVKPRKNDVLTQNVKKQENETNKKNFHKNENTVFVGNLGEEINTVDLKKHFLSKVSKVKDVRVILDKQSKTKRGFAYVEFDNAEDREKAFALHNTTLKGRQITVLNPADSNRQGKRQDTQKKRKFTSFLKPGKSFKRSQ